MLEGESMNIKVKMFAMLKEMTGKEEICLELNEGASCAEALLILENEYENFRVLFENSLLAINGEYTHRYATLQEDDEVAILPPVSGG